MTPTSEVTVPPLPMSVGTERGGEIVAHAIGEPVESGRRGRILGIGQCGEQAHCAERERPHLLHAIPDDLHELERPATDVEDAHPVGKLEVGPRAQEREAALGLAIDDLDVEFEACAGACDEVVAVSRLTDRFGGNRADERRIVLLGEEEQVFECGERVLHTLLGERARLGDVGSQTRLEALVG